MLPVLFSSYVSLLIRHDLFRQRRFEASDALPIQEAVQESRLICEMYAVHRAEGRRKPRVERGPLRLLPTIYS